MQIQKRKKSRTVNVSVTGGVKALFYHSCLHHNHANIWKVVEMVEKKENKNEKSKVK